MIYEIELEEIDGLVMQKKKKINKKIVHPIIYVHGTLVPRHH